MKQISGKKSHKDESTVEYVQRIIEQLGRNVVEDPDTNDNDKKHVKQAAKQALGQWSIIGGLVLFFMSMSALVLAGDGTAIVLPAINYVEIIGIVVVAVYEVLVRLKPTSKDWSIISLLAFVIETFIPNRGPVVNKKDIEERAPGLVKDDERIETKWVGGRLWGRLTKR
jgi:hypothetical protein